MLNSFNTTNITMCSIPWEVYTMLLSCHAILFNGNRYVTASSPSQETLWTLEGVMQHTVSNLTL